MIKQIAITVVAILAVVSALLMGHFFLSQWILDQLSTDSELARQAVRVASWAAMLLCWVACFAIISWRRKWNVRSYEDHILAEATAIRAARRK